MQDPAPHHSDAFFPDPQDMRSFRAHARARMHAGTLTRDDYPEMRRYYRGRMRPHEDDSHHESWPRSAGPTGQIRSIHPSCGTVRRAPRAPQRQLTHLYLQTAAAEHSWNDPESGYEADTED